ADGETVGTAEYTVVSSGIEEPAIPIKTGYTGEWEKYLLVPGGITINAVYTPIVYYAKFYADDILVDSIEYTVESVKIAQPEVPVKAGYVGNWEPYELTAGGIIVKAVYAEGDYMVTFYADGIFVKNVGFKTGARFIDEPNVPQKDGYTASWEKYAMRDENFSVNAEYTPIIYKAKFYREDNTLLDIIEFTVIDEFIDCPSVPAKSGYVGRWDDVSVRLSDVRIYPVYSPIAYFAVFVADGEEIARIEYTLESKVIDEPEVPEKKNHRGEWEDYSLQIGGVTVNAVYECTDISVTFILNGHGAAIEELTVPYGEKAVKPVDPIESGFVFCGWFTDEGFENEFNFISDLTSDTVLYALWTESGGKCGENTTWSFDSENGRLVITGTGATADYPNADSLPWALFRDRINSVEVADGVSSLGQNLFTDLKNVSSVTVASSVTAVKENAFNGCDSLSNVYFSGNINEAAALKGNAQAAGGNDDFINAQWTTEALEGIRGDVNEDGEVDDADIIYLQRWYAGWQGYSVKTVTGDLNGDGEVDDADIIYLQRWYAGWQGYTVG
ncbi:MAG: InlB B-repeat-containing protein, partial [Clostridiales bacterium]|nr:InlB B-repeat-containing protein [Clostridiales bacterium]